VKTKLSNRQKRLAFINRQPSLWRHSCPAVEIEPIDDDENDTIQVSPLMLEPLNADMDGDTMAIYAIHDVSALKEMEEKAYLINNVFYDQNNNFLATIRHEALFAAFILTKDEINKNNIIAEISNVQDLPESLDLWNEHLYDAVKLNDELYSYGTVLFNKWCGFNRIIINKSITKKHTNEVSAAIYDYYNHDSRKYYDSLTALERKLFAFITISNYCPSLDVSEMINLKDEQSNHLIKQLPDNNILLGYHINEAITKRCISKLNKKSSLYKLFKSGSRFSESQLARSCISVGYSADANNNVIPQPIRTSLLEGLTEEEYFLASPGTRKSIKDKAKFTPMSGYMERTLVMALSPLELSMEDCGTNTYLEIIISSQKHAQTLVGKWYYNEASQNWEVLDLQTANNLIRTKIKMKSAMTCTAPNFKLCKKCFGTREFPTKYVGITAGQNLTERITQLILRTFHESGRASLKVNTTIRDFFKNHLIDIKKDGDNTILIFDTNNFPEVLTYVGDDAPIPNLISVNVTNNCLTFGPDNRVIPNEDVISIMEQIKAVTKHGDVKKPPSEYYQDLMTLLLSVGVVYSSFVEMLFTNMFIIGDPKDRRFWRYHQDEAPTYKLGDTLLALYINPLLGLLYQPNKQTIGMIDLDKVLTADEPTIYEKIWMNKL